MVTVEQAAEAYRQALAEESRASRKMMETQQAADTARHDYMLAVGNTRHARSEMLKVAEW